MSSMTNISDKIIYIRQQVLKYGINDAYRKCEHNEVFDELKDYYDSSDIKDIILKSCGIPKDFYEDTLNNKDKLSYTIKRYDYISSLIEAGMREFIGGDLENVLQSLTRKTNHKDKFNTLALFIDDHCKFIKTNHKDCYYLPNNTIILPSKYTKDLNIDVLKNCIILKLLKIDIIKQMMLNNLEGCFKNYHTLADPYLESSIVVGLVRSDYLNSSLGYLMNLSLDVDKFIPFNLLLVPNRYSLMDKTYDIHWIGRETISPMTVNITTLNKLFETGQLDNLHCKDGELFLINSKFEEYIRSI